jgi:hypothetical protein
MIAAKVASSGALDKIAAEWRMPKELASDLVRPICFTCGSTTDSPGQAIALRYRSIHRRLWIHGL